MPPPQTKSRLATIHVPASRSPPVAGSPDPSLGPAFRPIAAPGPSSPQARAQREMMRLVRAAVFELVRAVPKEEAARLALELRDGAASGGFGVSCKGRILLVYPDKDGATIRFRASAGAGKTYLDRHMTATPFLKAVLVEQAARALVRDFIGSVTR